MCMGVHVCVCTFLRVQAGPCVHVCVQCVLLRLHPLSAGHRCPCGSDSNQAGVVSAPECLMPLQSPKGTHAGA